VFEREGKMKNILLCGFKKEVADILLQILTSEGYNPSVAQSNNQAITLLNENGFELAIVSLNLCPGGINGFALVKQIKDDFPDVKRLAINESNLSAENTTVHTKVLDDISGSLLLEMIIELLGGH